MRIHIIGAAGAGKTTLAMQLAGQMHLHHIELDGYYWLPGWRRSSDACFRDTVRPLLESEDWIMDGTYDTVRDLIWRRVDMVIWLDYAAPVVIWRLLRRSIRDIIRQTDLWGTSNRESWRLLVGRDSLILRAVRTARRMRTTYPALFAQSVHRHIHFVWLRSQWETRHWLSATLRASLSCRAEFCPTRLCRKLS